MNHSEAEKFTDELIIAFPAFKAVAEKHSPNFERTKDAWKVAWLDLTLAECREASRKLLIAGGLDYEALQQPGATIRQLVLRDRKNTPMSEDELVSHSQQQREAAKRRAEYQKLPMDATMQRAFAVGRAMLDRGEPMYLVHDVTDRIIAGEDVGDLKKAV
jgi:hypothetical protein